ncbi:GNAT family N-acetyltransferase [Paenibacillus sp. OSY-SE]|uniref:GNAT family N-acetyltransferase n=1 Tax=Paenibacillus sp. OSY-SE TaxID=1196323 RepID=UPI0002F64A86|nr:GNAT family N-acetyltransferase [Paenibacillus sp. OSY-SE]
MKYVLPELNIQEVNRNIQDQAKSVILEGLAERFGFLDNTLNPDLDDIILNYIGKGDVFLVGLYESRVVCTGALQHEGDHTVRIVRMSVAKQHRRRGYAKEMIYELEKRAVQKNYRRIILETNHAWKDAIAFYHSNGYTEYAADKARIHMNKIIG